MHGRSLALVVATIGFTSVAHAQPELTVTAGAGGLAESFADRPYHAAAGVQADVMVRFHRAIAAGVHFGIDTGGTFELSDQRSQYSTEYRYGYEPVQLGVTAQYVIADRVWLSSWVGFQDRFLREICSDEFSYTTRPGYLGCSAHPPKLSNQPRDYEATHELAFGLSVGGDILVLDAHRFGAFASVTRADQGPRPDTSFWFGLAYRYWTASK